MPTYLYKPDCALSDKNGFITKEDYYMHLSFSKEDKWMTHGNKRVQIEYISDEMNPTRHMSHHPNSKYYKLYTSKKKFRDETRARGCIEVGNEIPYMLKPRKYIPLSKKQRVEHIKQSLDQHRISDKKYKKLKRLKKI